MANAIDPKDFAGTLINALTEYRDVTEDKLKQIVDDLSKETRNQLKATSPKHSGGYKGKRVPGTYAKSWTYEPKKVGRSYKRVVYVKSPEYRLTHLLEFGHARVQGGRVVGRVSAQPHIGKAEQKAIEEFERRLVQEL